MSNVKKLQLISLIGGMTFYTPIFTLFLLQRSFNLGFVVAAQTLFSVGMMLSVVPTGVLADRLGQKIAIQIGLLMDAMGMLMLLITRSPEVLLFFFGTRGIAIGFRNGSDEALLYDSYIDEKKSADGYSRAFGKLISNDTLGFVIATAIAGIAVALLGQGSYTPLIIGTSLATFTALGIASTLQDKRHAVPVKAVKFFSQLKQGGKIVRNNKTIWALAVAGLLTLNGEYFLRQTYQPFFQDMAVPAIFLGVALSAGKLLNFLALRNMHRLEKFMTVDQILLGLNLIMGGAFIAFALVGSALGLVAMFILIQTTLNAQQPIVSDYVNQQIDSQQRSTTLSTVSFIQNLGTILTRILLGISVGIIGLGHTFIAQGLYLVVGAFIGVWYLRRCGCVHKISHTPDELIPVISNT